MERIQYTLVARMGMGLHGGEWRIHASAVDECNVIRDALNWLSGGTSEIVALKEKSTLGAPMQTISVKMKGKQALSSLGTLENESLVSILENELDSRVDEDKFLHVRLNLEMLVQGKGIISHNSHESVVKGKFKLEVYPGQDSIEIAENLLIRLIGD